MSTLIYLIHIRIQMVLQAIVERLLDKYLGEYI